MKKIINILFCFTMLSLLTLTLSLRSSLPPQNFADNPKSYIVMDANTKRVVKGDNYNTKSLVASVAKIMTAIIAIENGRLYDFVQITKEDTEMVGSKIGVKEGDQMLLIDLIYGLMLRSGNDAANAISRSVFGSHEKFINKMNEKAKEIGMTNSTFANASGLDEKEFNLSTAYDMALLTAYAMKNETFRRISGTKTYETKSFNQEKFNWTNKHKLVVNDDRFISGKTGYTKKAGRILVSVGNKNGREIIIVTINDPNDWETHKKLLEEVPALRNFRILERQVKVFLIGDEKRKVYIDENIYLALTTRESRQVSITFYVSPIESKMVVYLNERSIFTRIFRI